jgi:DNA-binding winged helix-turn-helix (wHTH) protein
MAHSETGAQMMRLGAYTLDPIRNVLIRDAREAPLTPLATRLLQLLASKPGEVFERKDIVAALWRGDWMTGDGALNRLVSEIRRAAGDDSRAPTLIQTVPRRGYRLVVSPSAATPAVAWPQAWRLANTTLAIAIGGFALIFVLAILARLFR